jgi:hypothetical protein
MRSPIWSPIRNVRAISAVILLCASLAVVALPITALASPWIQHKHHMGFLLRAIDNAENEVRASLRRKEHAQEPAELAEVMAEIGRQYKALKKLQKEYEEERSHVRFEHPERADQLERNYVRRETKSVEELANDIGIDGRLDRIRILVLSTFPIPIKEEPKVVAPPLRLPSSLKDVQVEDVPDPVVLRK